MAQIGISKGEEIMQAIDLTTLLRPLRRWWWLLVLGAVLSAVSGVLYLLQQPPTYVSRTTLVVGSVITDPNPSGAEINLAQQLAHTYADVAKREPLRQAAKAVLGIEWLPNYSVQVLPQTQIIEIQVFAGDPQLTYEVARVLAQELILQGPAGREQQEREDFIDTELGELQTSITETRAEIQQKQQELTTLFSAREIDRTQGLIQALEGKLSSLQANYAALLSTTQQGAANTLSILEPASLPSAPIDSQLVMNLLVAIILGFTLAAGGAYLLEFLDDSLKVAADVQELFGAPVLTSVPTIGDETSDNKLIMLQTTPIPAMEAYRLLRINLEYASVDKPNRTILVAGASAQDGKSVTAANLATVYARAGKKVILVDADLHRPTQQRLFKVTNNIGLTTALLSDEISYDSLLQSTIVPNLRIFTTGPLPPNPAELLSSKRMQETLSKLLTMADLVIIDSPPLTTVTDGIVLATLVDGVLMVARCGKTRRTNAKRAGMLLSQVQSRLLGIVFNGVAGGDNAYQSYYGYYRHQRTDFPSKETSVTQPLHNFELTPQRSNGFLSLRQPKAKVAKPTNSLSSE